jgi:hypothetical protein
MVTWDGTGRVDLYLSVDGGGSWQLHEIGLSGGSHRLIVPHTPSRFAAVKLERTVPRSVGKTPGLFTIETSIALLSFGAKVAKDGGALITWSSDPGPADLGGYRLERADPGATWRTIVALTGETAYTDRDAGAGARYRLFGVNGLGEELLLGEAALASGAALSAWPLPYRGGDLRIRFATASGLGGGRGQATVDVHDISGRRVRRLAAGLFEPGFQTAIWDGRDDRGALVGAGIYFLRSRSGNESTALKVVVVR